MAEGEFETQMVEHNATKLEMKASKNRFEIEILDGDRKGERLDLVYKPSEKSWNAVKQNGELIKLSSIEDGLIVYHLPDGEKFKLDPASSRDQGFAQINDAIYCYKGGVTAVGN